MYSCSEYSYTSSDDDENIEFAVANRTCKLTPLNFTTYEMCGDTKQLELGLPQLDFDKSKLSLSPCKINPNSYKVLYDGKKFRLFLKAFDGKIKKSRCFNREKHLKVRNICMNRMLWEVFWNIEEKVRESINQEKKCSWFIEWNRIWLNFCDKRLTRKQIYHFEEAAVAVDKVIIITDTEFVKEFRLVSEMIDAHVLLPSICDK